MDKSKGNLGDFFWGIPELSLVEEAFQLWNVEVDLALLRQRCLHRIVVANLTKEVMNFVLHISFNVHLHQSCLHK